MTNAALKNTVAARRSHKRRGRGSLSLEYVVLLVVGVAALLSMAIYLKRSLAGRWRQVGDTFGYGRQYEPGKTVK